MKYLWSLLVACISCVLIQQNIQPNELLWKIEKVSGPGDYSHICPASKSNIFLDSKEAHSSHSASPCLRKDVYSSQDKDEILWHIKQEKDDNKHEFAYLSPKSSPEMFLSVSDEHNSYHLVLSHKKYKWIVESTNKGVLLIPSSLADSGWVLDNNNGIGCIRFRKH